MMRPPEDVGVRFWRQVIPEPNSGCLLWTGTRNELGYGLLKMPDGTHLRAHRLSWLLHYGPPGNSLVLHRCDVTSCVAPNHLFIGTPKDNTQDSISKGRFWFQGKQACRQGHPWVPENLYEYTSLFGYKFRKCKSCCRIANLRRRHRHA